MSASVKTRFVLRTPSQAQALWGCLKTWRDMAEAGTPLAVTIEQANQRSDDQNRLFHAICSTVAKSGTEWMGKARTAEQWKVLFVSGHQVATRGSTDMVPGLEGEFVNLRESTSRMSKARASSLIEYVMAWCAEHNIHINHKETA